MPASTPAACRGTRWRRGLRKDADQIIAELIKEDDESMARAQTAAVVLYVRYLKRVGAHLLNILSSVVNPFERTGYKEQDRT